MGSNVSGLMRQDNFGFPPELIEHIVQYISFHDLLKCRLVCQEWNERAERALVLSAVYLVDFSRGDSRELLYAKTAGTWKRFVFLNRYIIHSPNFWNKYHMGITSLEFWNCLIVLDPSDRDYVPFSNKDLMCPNLRHLAVNNCVDYFRDCGSTFPLQNIFQLENLRSLDLSYNPRYLTDKVVLGILEATRFLESLDLSYTNICGHSCIFNRFYPSLITQPSKLAETEYSDDVFTFQLVQNAFLSTNKAIHLQRVNFNGTGIGGNTLPTLLTMTENILTSVSIQQVDISPQLLLFVNFLKRQRFITKLKVSLNLHNATLEQSEFLERAFANLTNLRKLSVICNYPSVVLDTIKDGIKNVKHLTVIVTRTTSTNRHNDHIFLIPVKILDQLQTLKLNCFGKSCLLDVWPLSPPLESCMESVVESLKKVTKLNLSCSRLVTDVVVQTIIRTCRGLRHLNLSSCELISDLGVAGKFVGSRENVQYDDNLILPEAWQKWIARPPHDLPAVSLKELKGLITLNLTNCKRLSTATFEDAIDFMYLKKLGLIGTRVDFPALEVILKKCKSLIVLESNCAGAQREVERILAYRTHPSLAFRTKTNFCWKPLRRREIPTYLPVLL